MCLVLIQIFSGLSVLLCKYSELRDLKYLNGQNLCDHVFEADSISLLSAYLSLMAPVEIVLWTSFQSFS